MHVELYRNLPDMHDWQAVRDEHKIHGLTHDEHS